MRAFLAVLLLTSAGDVKSSELRLRQVLAAGQQKQLASAVQELAGWDNVDAMKALLRLAAQAPPGTDNYFWMEAYAFMLRGAAAMANSSALQEAADFILANKSKTVARDLLAMLCNQGRPEMVPPMLVILEKGPDEMRVQAAEHLVTIGDPRCIESLIAALRDAKASAELKRRAAHALAAITGQNYGDNASNWEGWWASNKDKPLQGPSTSETGGGTTVALDRGRGSEWEELKKNAKVLVLGAGKKCRCGHDHDLDNIERTCAQLGLEAVFVDKVAFEKDECKPEDYIAILANCTHIREHCACPQCKPGKYSGDRLFTCECPINKHEPVRYLLGEPGVRKIKKYVEKGGYVFAEDWCMEDFVEKAFGDYVRHGTIRGADEEIPVLAAPGAMSHAYLKKIFFKGYKPKEGKGTVSEDELKEVVHTWKIDKETRTIKIVDPKKVVTLLTSPELEKYAQGDDAVAVTFVVGGGRPSTATSGGPETLAGGRVLYVLSHFGKQKSSEDEYSLQNLMINFLVEAYARRAPMKKNP